MISACADEDARRTAHQPDRLVLAEAGVGEPELPEPAHLRRRAPSRRTAGAAARRRAPGEASASPPGVQPADGVVEHPVEQRPRTLAVGSEGIDPDLRRALHHDGPVLGWMSSTRTRSIHSALAPAAESSGASGHLLPALGAGPVQAGPDQQHLGGSQARGADDGERVGRGPVAPLGVEQPDLRRAPRPARVRRRRSRCAVRAGPRARARRRRRRRPTSGAARRPAPRRGGRGPARCGGWARSSRPGRAARRSELGRGSGGCAGAYRSSAAWRADGRRRLRGADGAGCGSAWGGGQRLQ